jgi:hypothetical protein
MRSHSIALVGAGLVLTAHCHRELNFTLFLVATTDAASVLQGILLVNGTETKEWQYVR